VGTNEDTVTLPATKKCSQLTLVYTVYKNYYWYKNCSDIRSGSRETSTCQRWRSNSVVAWKRRFSNAFGR